MGGRSGGGGRAWMAALGASIVLLTAATAGAGQEGPAHVEVERLTERVLLLRDGLGSGTVLLYEGTGHGLLVDAGDPASAAAIVQALDTLSTGPVDLVVSTHYHRDHLGANPRLRAAGAVVWADPRVGEEAARDTFIPEWRWRREASPAEALPDSAIVGRTVLLPEACRGLPSCDRPETVVAEPIGAAHTGTDLLVWLPEEDVVHVGDLIEVGAYPFIDWWAGGSLQGMIDELDRLLPRLSDRTRVVPGHGPVIDRADAAGYREMLATILARARAARASGEDLDAFLAGRPTAEFDAGRGGARRGRQFATLVWLGVAGGGASD